MFETLKKILVEQLNVEESLITPEAELAKDLGVNSLELADLVLLCEEKYDLTIDEDAY
ncbi:MAG: acyl carrier protein, partial [Clostridia bacterium]|nr:acyl carrier protein [Clostridia bacterium]